MESAVELLMEANVEAHVNNSSDGSWPGEIIATALYTTELLSYPLSVSAKGFGPAQAVTAERIFGNIRRGNKYLVSLLCFIPL